MHVGLLAPAWPYGVRPNGIVTYVHHMTRELRSLGHRVTVFAGELDALSVDDAVVAVPSVSARSRLLDRLRGRRRTVYDAWREIAAGINARDRRDRIDVVEMEETFGLFADVARHVRPPVIPKLHGPGFLHLMEEEVATPEGQRRIAAEGRALATASVVTAPSSWTLRQTITRYALAPVVAEPIGNPIEVPMNTDLWRPDRCDPHRILFVGRFDKVKGADLVIRALSHLVVDRPRLRLTFVGPDRGLLAADGSRASLPEFVQSLGQAGLADRIDYRGALHPGDIEEPRRQAAVTVVASRQESLGYTAMEAMVRGCPLVSMDSSGLAELVEHGVTGLKARFEDPLDLALQIGRLLDDRSLAMRLGTAGRAFVSSRFAPASIVRQTLQVYERALAICRMPSPPGAQ